MTSIIKVDEIQLSDGTTPTASDLGVSLTSADMPAGSIVQVVTTGHFVNDFNTSSTTKTKTNLSIDITPKFSNSLIVVHFQANFLATNQNAGGVLYLHRDDTVNLTSSPTDPLIHGDYDNNGQYNPYLLQTVDYPNTTNTVNYSVYAKASGGLFYVYRNQIATAYEIAQ